MTTTLMSADLDSEGQNNRNTVDLDDSGDMIIPGTDRDGSMSDDDGDKFDDMIDSGVRRMSRVATEVDSDDIREVREQLRAAGVDTKDVHLAEVDRICAVGVKPGVRWWNFIMIPINTCIIMIVSTFINAQIIFLLENPDFFDVPADKIGVVSS